MSHSPKKHDKLKNTKHATVSLDSLLGLLSSAYGTEELDSSIIFDKDTINWTNISVENLKAIPKREDISERTKKEKNKETKVNAATSTTNLKSKTPNEDDLDETLFSIRSLVSLQQIKNKSENSINENFSSTSTKVYTEDVKDASDNKSSTTLLKHSAGMEDPNAKGDYLENQNDDDKASTPVCGFYVDDSSHKVIFDIQFVKKIKIPNEVMPVFSIGEPEILLSVSDITKQMKTNITVAKCNLVSKVQYFAEVEKEFGLENLDIIVKCNFGVFQWIVQWIKSDIPMCKPHLNTSNLKAILSMAYHLGIIELVQECLDYFSQNISLVLNSDCEIEDSLDDKLLLDLTTRFSNTEIERIDEEYESFKTKLYCALIKLLADPTPNKKIGHFSSLATIFQCGFCGKFMHSSMKNFVPCRTDCSQLNLYGKLEFYHESSSFWNLSKYIELMYEELKSWRLVYWRLWGICHFSYCEVCESWYPLCQGDWCPYHPGEVEYFPMTNNLFYPVGTHGCCGEKTFKFDTVKSHSGCKHKSHVSKLDTIEKVEKYNIYQDFKQFINSAPPEESKIKKFIKLVKTNREDLTSPNELTSEKFWWEGIRLGPEVKKDYSLIPLYVLNNLRNRIQEKPTPKIHILLKYDSQVPFGAMLPLEERSAEGGPQNYLLSQTTQPPINKKNRPKLLVKKGKSQNIVPGTRCKSKKKKALSYVYQPTDSMWTDLESNKDNQDNQRDFEEIAMRKLVKMLTPSDSSGVGIESSAGSYIRLETEWWNRNCGSHLDKSSSTVVNRTFPLSWFRRLTI